MKVLGLNVCSWASEKDKDSFFTLKTGRRRSGPYQLFIVPGHIFFALEFLGEVVLLDRVAGVVRVPGKLIDVAPGHRREGITEDAVGDGDALATVIEVGGAGEFRG